MDESRIRHKCSGCRGEIAPWGELRPDPLDSYDRFQLCLPVSLYVEWQAVLTRKENLSPGANEDDARGFLRYLASQCHVQEIHFLWRPSSRCE
jgi:hypothetical protein